MNGMLVNGNLKRNDNVLWVSKTVNCIAFKEVAGYKAVVMENAEELWKLVEQLVTTGFKVR